MLRPRDSNLMQPRSGERLASWSTGRGRHRHGCIHGLSAVLCCSVVADVSGRAGVGAGLTSRKTTSESRDRSWSIRSHAFFAMGESRYLPKTVSVEKITDEKFIDVVDPEVQLVVPGTEPSNSG